MDESGQATYAISIAVPPGTAGVAPTLSLNYSSQGTTGVLGKGWTLGGPSSIARCRKTREAGDFFFLGVPVDGNSLPVGLNSDDVFCLDGQRLLLVSGTYGANNAVYHPELDPWTRVTSKNGDNSSDPASYTGPQHFIIERKDGSLSEYGNSSDSRVERNQCGGVTGVACATSAWALNRTEDSTGNYLTWHYKKFLAGTETTDGLGSDEYVLSEVRYTGKRVLTGQGGSASTPYARVLFGYSADTTHQQLGWQSGSRLAQTRRLDWIKVQDPYTVTPRTVRYYALGYTTSGSNSGSRHLATVQECNKGPGDTAVDATQVCYPATTFTESTAKYQFNAQADSDVSRDVNDRKGARYGDVDGDGRLDLVWSQETTESVCKGRLFVSYGDRFVDSGTSKLTLATPAQAGVCMTTAIANWQLLDYNGDGRDDLMLSNALGVSQRWTIYSAAQGRPTSSGASAFATDADLLGAVVIPNPDDLQTATLIELNGDGLLDVLYPVEIQPGNGVDPPVYELRGRLRERYESSPGVFALRFGAETSSTLAFAPTDPCSPSFAGSPRPTSCYHTLSYAPSLVGQPSEFDGDGRGDLMIEVTRVFSSNPRGQAAEIRYLPSEQIDALREASLPQGTTTFERYFYFFAARPGVNIFGAFLGFESVSTPLRIYEDGTGELPTGVGSIQPADFNGDGLTDLLYRVPSVTSGETWRLRLNTGKGFSSTHSDATGITNPGLAQVSDVNGDGRADLLYPPTGNTCGAGDTSNSSRPFCVRYGQAGSVSLAPPRHVAGSGALATSSPFDHEHYFADFDGDGASDYVRFKIVGGASDLFTSRSSTRHKAREVVVQFTDGIGATTQIDYQPLTNSAVYRRDTGSLVATTTNGRGSPTFDLLAPIYVVAKASSSAPTHASASGMVDIGYRYAGAKMQSGGRGFLGFREIASFDGAHDLASARHVVSRTSYRQDFPFVGNPNTTTKFAVSSTVSFGTSAIDACRNDPETTSEQCFYTVGAVWPAASGAQFSSSLNVWACQGTLNDTTCPIETNTLRAECIDEAASVESGEFNPLGTQQPIFPYLTGSLEEAHAYNTTTSGNGAKLSSTTSAFCYEDDYGNLTYSKVDHWNGANEPVKVQITDNTWSNDATAWRLGRLTESKVDVSDSCVANPVPGNGPICSSWKTRKSAFVYDTTSSAKTGLLNQEKLQPGGGADQELRTLYTLDAYGNQTHAFQCSAFEADGTTLTDAECKTTGRVKHRLPGEPGEVTAVHRYSRSVFDAAGRFVTSTRLPYYSESGTNNVVELESSAIGPRDEFGNITQQTDINGKVATLRFGALGRPYYAGDNTGASSTTTYRWCSSVSCPADAVYRSQTVAANSGGQAAAPTAWTYHDKLGRPILSVTQAFATGVTGQDFSAVCTYFDRKTRPERTSDPFFLTTSAVGGAPDFQGGSYVPCSSPAWTRVEFDVLGRPTKTTLPDASQTTVSYSGLATTTVNPEGQIARETRNSLGQVTQLTQANPATPGVLGMSVDMDYDAQGNLLSLTRNAGQGDVVSVHEYDALGRRTKSIDPDRGTEHAFYNAAGEAIRTTDASGLAVRMDIDALGRVWRRYSGRATVGTAPLRSRIFASGFEVPGLPPAGLVTDVWEFDTAANGKGLLHFEERTTTVDATYRRTMTYDNRGRPATRATLLDASTFTEGWSYDGFGRPYLETDASGSTVERTFTSRGFPYQLRNAATPSEVYQQFTAQDARGQVTHETRGAAAIVRTFHPRGWLTGLTTTAGTTLQQLTYQHDLLGNVTQRRDLRGNQIEDFDYDGLNRLESATATVGGNPAMTVMSLTYDTLGNICSKNGQAYSYAGRDGCNATGTSASASPHAVTQIGGKNYLYGMRGELDYANDTAAPAQDRWFGYDGLQQLSVVVLGSIVSPSAELELKYGPGGERYRRQEKVGGGTTTTRYIGSVERITRPSGVIETKRSIAGILIQTSFSDATPTTKRYLYPDALGSLDVIANEAGTLQERLSFDAHGSRRNGSDWRNAVTGYTPQTTTDGFTGHEHLDPFGLIHMNGRVYDPSMGRFIQADPVLDVGIQGLNRYSYVLNNPLTLTDPTGYSSWGRWLRTIAAIAITIYSGGSAAGATWGLFGSTVTAGQAFAITVAGGFAAGAVQSGSFKGGLYGALSAMAFYGIGNTFSQANAPLLYSSAGNLNSVGMVAKTVSHGFVGGVMSELQGGKFGHGFVSAGATQAVSPQIDSINSVPGQVVAAAMLGGTVSATTGGKFANGAVTAAFSRTFNDIMHYKKAPDGQMTVESPAQQWEGAGDAFYAIPGVDVVGCIIDGCTSAGWSFATLGVLPFGKVTGAAAKGYSVAFETVISKAGIGTRASHFANANANLAAAMSADPILANMMRDMGVAIPGRIGQSPVGWTWHHVSDQPGVLQLVPRLQHQGSSWQSILHPNQTGGFKLWGHDY